MEIIKIGAVALTGMLFAVLMRNKNPTAAALTALACTLVIASYMLGAFEDLFSGFSRLLSSGGLDPVFYKSIIKVIGVAYFSEIISGLCRDAGQNAIAAKVEIAGRVFVLTLTLPVVTELMNVIIGALDMI